MKKVFSMKLLVISFCTTGVMRDQFISYCCNWASKCNLFCITNDNVTMDELGCQRLLNLSYKRKKPWSYFSLIKLRKIKKFINDINPDIVLFFTPSPVNIFLSRFVSKKFNYAVQIHDPIPHLGLNLLDRMIRVLQIKRHIKYADKIFVAGEALKNQINNHYKYPLDKISSIQLALTDNVKFEYDNKPREYVYDAIFFGRIEYYKGIDDLIEATKYLNSESKIAIVGKGKEYYDIRKAYCKVDYLNDFVDDKKLANMIVSSKVVVLPYKEASGTMTIALAFNYGKPVVATDVGCFKEYVGEAGFIVKQGDNEELGKTINLITNDEKLLMKYSKMAFERKDFFSLDFVCDKYLTELSELLDCDSKN